jgi:hypothetical protein
MSGGGDDAPVNGGRGEAATAPAPASAAPPPAAQPPAAQSVADSPPERTSAAPDSPPRPVTQEKYVVWSSGPSDTVRGPEDR